MAMADVVVPSSPEEASEFGTVLREVYDRLESLKQSHVEDLARVKKGFLKEKKELLEAAKADQERHRRSAKSALGSSGDMAEDSAEVRGDSDPERKAEQKLIRNLKVQVERLKAELEKRMAFAEESIAYVEFAAKQGERKKCLFCTSINETTRKWRERSDGLQAEERAEAERQGLAALTGRVDAGGEAGQDLTGNLPEKTTEQSQQAGGGDGGPQVVGSKEPAKNSTMKDEEVVENGRSSDEDEARAGLIRLLAQRNAEAEQAGQPADDRRPRRGLESQSRKRAELNNWQEVHARPRSTSEAEAQEDGRVRPRHSKQKNEGAANGNKRAHEGGEGEERRSARRRKANHDNTATTPASESKKHTDTEEASAEEAPEEVTKKEKAENGSKAEKAAAADENTARKRRDLKGKKEPGGSDRYKVRGNALYEDFEAFCPPKYGMGGDGFRGLLRVMRSGECLMICKCRDCFRKAGSDGNLMSPVEFELHAGRGATKKWRHSIWIIGPDEKRATIEKSEWLKGGKGLIPVAAPREAVKADEAAAET